MIYREAVDIPTVVRPLVEVAIDCFGMLGSLVGAIFRYARGLDTMIIDIFERGKNLVHSRLGRR